MKTLLDIICEAAGEHVINLSESSSLDIVEEEDDSEDE
jgi:hypothetical protein